MAMDVDQWWDSLPQSRKTQIMTWLDHTSATELPTPGQLNLLEDNERGLNEHDVDL